jgi:anti-anti-sigma factor
MEVEAVPSVRGLTLLLRGDLDIASATALRHELGGPTWSGVVHIELDLSAVAFMDCAGLRALLGCVGSARRRGQHLSVTRISPSVSRLFDALGARGLLEAA